MLERSSAGMAVGVIDRLVLHADGTATFASAPRPYRAFDTQRTGAVGRHAYARLCATLEALSVEALRSHEMQVSDSVRATIRLVDHDGRATELTAYPEGTGDARLWAAQSAIEAAAWRVDWNE